MTLRNARSTPAKANGVGRLVDADMSDASTKLKAIQSQVQLAVQALNIANNAPSLLMQLFQ